ncbi:glycosyltransferase [Nitratidesulfovibrio sp. D1]|uniref:glycosyltransferase n=1 Tax=Nitratidesulfovibrio sp. D1 TaxID=3440151 RepID=UPI003EBDB858
MKIVFCIDDNPRYLLMMRAAVRSLRRLHGDAAPCVCVYGGKDTAVMDAVRAEGVQLARHTPVIGVHNAPREFHRCIGAFLKLELALLPELADDEYVLYCDADVYFHQPILGDAGGDAASGGAEHIRPPYMAMAREATAPFHHAHEQLDYEWRGRRYVVPLPFPIWTFSSGVVLFNLARLRRHDHVHNFLAFCVQNLHRIGNLDQSLLNYFFGKRVTKLDPSWNCPPYRADALTRARIVHFHGPKPWDTRPALWKDLRINHYAEFRRRWLDLLTPEEREQAAAWEAAG